MSIIRKAQNEIPSVTVSEGNDLGYERHTAQNEAPALDDEWATLPGERVRSGSEREYAHGSRAAEAASDRAPRQETNDYLWTRPSSLETPDENPGMVQRWIRAEMRTETDTLNWQGKMREGWVPRDPRTVPGFERMFGANQHLGRSVIRVGGLILCEMPEQLYQSKKKWVRNQVRKLEDSVRADTDKVSEEGMKMGFAPIKREEETEVRVDTRRKNNVSRF